MGIPYLYGGGHGARPAPLRSRVDCSGFVRELYAYAFGVDIGGGSGDSMIRLSGQFSRTTRPVPGDVVLLGNGGAGPAYHAGIYLGIAPNGQPAMAAAPTTGQNIKIQQWMSWAGRDTMGYWHYRGATVADSGSVTPVAAPLAVRGHFDGVVPRRTGSVVTGFIVRGWAYDRRNPAAAAPVSISMDGVGISSFAAGSVLRPDVNRIFGIGGVHGFAIGFSVPAGRHQVCLTARAAGTASQPLGLGCRPVNTYTATRGVFDGVAGGRHLLRVRGWALDPRDTVHGNRVTVSIDGRPSAILSATSARPDVNRALGVAGAHGFGVPIAATPGRHAVCAVSLPRVAGSIAQSLGCRAVVVLA